MFARSRALRCTLALIAATVAGCGHSEDEWRAKVREAEDLRGQLATEQALAKKTKAELDETSARAESLSQKLRAAGVDVDRVGAGVEEQARALELMRVRKEQLAAFKKRHEALKKRLAQVSGVSVVVAQGKLVIRIADDALFERGREVITKDGGKLIKQIGDAIRGDGSLAQRSFQVVGHAEKGASPGRHKDLWGESAARAREVLAILAQPADRAGGGLDAARLSVAGRGDADAIDKGKTSRRVEIVMTPSPEEVLAFEVEKP